MSGGLCVRGVAVLRPRGPASPRVVSLLSSSLLFAQGWIHRQETEVAVTRASIAVGPPLLRWARAAASHLRAWCRERAAGLVASPTSSASSPDPSPDAPVSSRADRLAEKESVAHQRRTAAARIAFMEAEARDRRAEAEGIGREVASLERELERARDELREHC